MSYASWRKCDFQLHTPRDPNWQGERPIGLGNQTENGPATQEQMDEARQNWASKFTDRCVARDLNAVAITDHNEMVMIPYVQREIAQRRSQDPNFNLWLFPGMELTCRNGVQCLILFDADLSTKWLCVAQAKLGIAVTSLNETAKQGPAVTQLEYSYPMLAARLDSAAELKGRYIILPNVSKGGRHTCLVEGGHADFKEMTYVGGYLDCGQNENNIGGKNKRRLSGKEKAWGNRFIYPLPTSDSRSSDFSKLGNNGCWIKLGEPTAEAIRQAFLGYRSRIAITAPDVAKLSIRSIKIDGSAILADSQTNLSPELNSFIGGRGSGKSTLLEYLAFGLGKSCYDIERRNYSGTDRLKGLISETLISKGATLELEVLQDGASFVIRRSEAYGYQPVITYPDGNQQTLTTKQLRDQFSAVVYSQGELSEIGKQSGKRAELSDLLQFVDPEFKRENERISTDIEAAQLLVRQAVQNLATAWGRQAKMNKLSTSKAALEQRIGALQKTLPELSTADQQIVARYEGLVALDAKRAKATTQVATVMAEVRQLWHTSRAPVELTSDFPEAQELQTAYAAFNAAFAKDIEALGIKLGKESDALNTAGDRLSTSLEQAKEARDTVMSKLTEHISVTGQISNLQSELKGVSTQIGELEVNPISVDDAVETYQTHADQLKSALTLCGDKTKEWADKIETQSNERLEATLNRDSNWSEIHDAMSILTAKSGSSEAVRRQRTEKLLEEMGVWEFLDALRADALAALRAKLLSQSDSGDQPALDTLRGAAGGTNRILSLTKELIDLPRVEAIVSTVPRPDILLHYRDGERKISFEKASEGQRAAALLFMLLEQPGGPLLVDQPEGDLDNKIVSDLATKLHEAKKHRQILFASHNANIVVNGSSELVAGLDVTDDAKRGIVCDGAIDTSAVCNKITETMEGGEQAFRDRKDKYGY